MHDEKRHKPKDLLAFLYQNLGGDIFRLLVAKSVREFRAWLHLKAADTTPLPHFPPQHSSFIETAGRHLQHTEDPVQALTRNASAVAAGARGDGGAAQGARSGAAAPSHAHLGGTKRRRGLRDDPSPHLNMSPPLFSSVPPLGRAGGDTASHGSGGSRTTPASPGSRRRSTGSLGRAPDAPAQRLHFAQVSGPPAAPAASAGHPQVHDGQGFRRELRKLLRKWPGMGADLMQFLEQKTTEMGRGPARGPTEAGDWAGDAAAAALSGGGDGWRWTEEAAEGGGWVRSQVTKAHLEAENASLRSALEACQGQLKAARREAASLQSQVTASSHLLAHQLRRGVSTASTPAVHGRDTQTSMQACSGRAQAYVSSVARHAFQSGFAAGLYTVNLLTTPTTLHKAAAACQRQATQTARSALRSDGLLGSTQGPPSALHQQVEERSNSPPPSLYPLPEQCVQSALADTEAACPARHAGARAQPQPHQRTFVQCPSCQLLWGSAGEAAAVTGLRGRGAGPRTRLHDAVPARLPRGGTPEVLSAPDRWPEVLDSPEQWVRLVRGVLGPVSPADLSAAVTPEATRLAGSAAAHALAVLDPSLCNGRDAAPLQRLLQSTKDGTAAVAAAVRPSCIQGSKA